MASPGLPQHQSEQAFHPAPTPSPIGGRSFIDHARLRILLCPVGNVSESDFAKWCDYVRSFETIRLSDLPSSCAARRRAASHTTASGTNAPSSSTSPMLQTGEVHLSFVTSYDPDHAFLAPFNMHRQVLGALGLATYSNRAMNRHEIEAAPAGLREMHPGALVHRVFGFDSGAKRPETVDLSSIKNVVAAKINAAQRSPSPLLAEADLSADTASVQNSNAASASPQLPADSDTAGFSAQRNGGLMIFPAVRKDGKDVRFYLKTLLAELVGNILDGLDHIVTGLEGTLLETPRETLDGITSHNRQSTTSTASTASMSSWLSKTSAAAGLGARASSLFTAFSSNSGDAETGKSTPTSSRTSSAIGGGTHPFDLASPGSSTSSPTGENTTRSKILAANAGKKSSNAASKRITSSAGTGPTGTGRYSKVKADLHLLEGNLWAALEGYSSALTALGKERALAGGQDAVWFASALEGFSVARVLVSRMGGIVLEKAPNFDLPWNSTSTKDKAKENEKDGIPRPYSKQAWGEIAEAYTIAVVICSKCLAPPSVLLEPVRSVTNDSPRDYTHPLVHASACTQYARFLLAVWASGGWNGECFDQLVYGGVPPALAEEKPSNAMYLHLTSISGIARHDIAAAASSALSHSIIALKSTDQITLLSTLTAIFGCIGFSRREAHLLRQLQAVIVGLLVKVKKVSARPATTASLPVQQIEVGETELVGNIVAQTTWDGLGRGPEAVLVLALQVCETYGIHVEVDPLQNIPPWHILSKATEGLKSAYTSPAIGASEGGFAPNIATPDSMIKAKESGEVLTPLEIAQEAPFGWKEQQLTLLKETISIAELLSDFVAMAFFSAILLRDFHSLLGPEDQRDLMVGMQRSVQSARWAGAQDLAVKYWGPAEPLCSLELLPLPTERMPVERNAELLFPKEKAGQIEKGVAGLNNPFFWNPSSTTAAGKARAVAVQGEEIVVMATLQNPFAVELHIDTLLLVAEGAGFVAVETERVSIPPLSFQTIRLSGIAKETGKVTIKGITLTLAGGCTEKQNFLLPIYDEENAKSRRKQAAENDDRKTRLKVSGLDARSSVIKQKSQPSTVNPVNDTKQEKFMEVSVVPAQPTLAVYCSELEPMGAVELFEGEVEMIHLELENVSSTLEVNYVAISFTDDVSEAAKAALAEGELLPQDVYELEWNLVHQPVLSQLSPQAGGIRIKPGANKTIPIQVRGKIGCSRATVRVEYGHVDTDKLHSGLSSEGKIHLRQVEVDMGFTVHAVVVCRDLKIAPLKAAEAARLTKECLTSADSIPAHLRSFATDAGEQEIGFAAASAAESVGLEEDVEVVESQEEEIDDLEYCLLSLDVSNLHREDVLLRFSLNTGGVLPLHIYRVLRAGSGARIVLPQPRLELDPRTGKSFHLSSLSTQNQTGDRNGNVKGEVGEFPPIPSIWKEDSSRQFIVSKVQLCRDEEREMKKEFWYREALFSRLSGVWRTLPPHQSHSSLTLRDNSYGDCSGDDDEGDAVRFGKIPLRGMVSGGGLSLDTTSLINLEKEPVKLSLTFNNHLESSLIRAEEFTKVTATITNGLTRYLMDPLIRLVPTNPNPNAGVAVDAGAFGSSSDLVIVSDGTPSAGRVIGEWARGEEIKLEWVVSFLSSGRFGFLVLVEEPIGFKGQRLSYVSSLQSVIVLPAV
ncbi:related to hypercellular protein (hypa) [Melanopsichium pennsylvanicum]|uniref:Related to hypercellular protein (Hypa) n=2 Tax=Melanopsichium pennsylvanicum TaxID=63383 RepID=A0AAJ4XQP6_9BASI|nr:related to hypercellular protein (hypa) [Melanopsichium pennsylvanicum 4]SNX86196.1 related to hypercellular protein (hypa) [Melanopsichium pennsylvanicum]